MRAYARVVPSGENSAAAARELECQARHIRHSDAQQLLQRAHVPNADVLEAARREQLRTPAAHTIRNPFINESYRQLLNFEK